MKEKVRDYIDKKIIEILAQVKHYCESHWCCTYCAFYQKDHVGNGRSCVLHGEPNHWRNLSEEEMSL